MDQETATRNGAAQLDDIADLLAEAAARPDGGRPGRVVDIPMRAYLLGDIDELRRQLAEVENSDTDSFEGPAGAAELKEQIEELTGKLRASFRPFRLRAMPQPDYRALVDQHPPRRVTGDDGIERTHPRDQGSEFNIDTFYRPLIKASVVDPQLSDEQWQQMFDSVLTDHYFSRLGTTALFLNRLQVDVPFSPTASPTNPSSDGGSKPPGGSGSPSNGLTGGNRAARRATATTRKAASKRR